MSWTLVVWQESFLSDTELFLIETEKLAPYRKANGFIIGVNTKTDSDEDVQDDDEIGILINHLAYMIGVEPCFLSKIPSLDEYIKDKAAYKDQEEEIKSIQDTMTAEASRANAPWENCKLEKPYQISRYINDVMITGWLI